MAETKRNYGAGVHKTKLDYTDPMLLLEIEGLARDGFDDAQIAEILDVAPQTFGKAKRKKQPDGSESGVSAALRKGRRPLEVLVENSLYKRATGQKVTTKTTVTRFLEHPDGTVTDIKIVQVSETETELPGDYNSINLWLRAKKPDMYNTQPERIDLTTGGEKLTEPPQIKKIEHVNIGSDQVKKQEADV